MEPICVKAAPLHFKVAGVTDPGVPSRVNQDDFFIWKSPTEPGCFAMGMLDGHGRDVGQIASQVAAASIQESLNDPEVFAQIRTAPKPAFDQIFKTAHVAVRNAFREHYRKSGWDVTLTDGGYLTKKRGMSSEVTNVHGGTTVTIVVVLDGQKLVIANVGDSTCLLTGLKLPDGVLKEVDAAGGLKDVAEGAAAAGDAAALGTAAKSSAPPAPPGGADGVALLPADEIRIISADHSPESPEEFYRIRQFRQDPSNAHETELLMVYDSPSRSKVDCPRVFAVDGTGSCTVNNVGKYYKNVRHEWASLVTTPPHAAFSDALAFTRSLGDFHLQTWGVSHEPTVYTLDLADAPADANSGSTSAIILCTDGIWDNWTYKDAVDFVMDPARLDRINGSTDVNGAGGAEGGGSGSDAAEALVREFMTQNLVFAKSNFGSSMDNMTAVLCYIQQDE